MKRYAIVGFWVIVGAVAPCIAKEPMPPLCQQWHDGDASERLSLASHMASMVPERNRPCVLQALIGTAERKGSLDAWHSQFCLDNGATHFTMGAGLAGITWAEAYACESTGEPLPVPGEIP